MLLFVYGTLRRTFGGEMANQLMAESTWIGRAIVENAKLIRIAGDKFDYPALILLDQQQEQFPSKVHGEVVRLLNPTQTLAWLDEYEEFGPTFAQPNEYLRRDVPIQFVPSTGDDIATQPNGMQFEDKGQVIMASTYVWNWPINDDKGKPIAPVIGCIESGDWLMAQSQFNKS